MNILVIEDEPELASYIARCLSDHGHAVDCEPRGDDGLARVQIAQYDLLIVDRMLPGIDGLAVVRALRQGRSNTPVLFLSNLGSTDDRVEGLNAGGDDYLAKPFAPLELVARVNALLRRENRANEPTVLAIGELKMDLLKRQVSRAGVAIGLLPREFQLLEYLMRRPGQVATRTMLLEGVWNYHFDPKTNIVETHISRLRAKIGSDFIQTMRGSGYLIRAPKSAA